MSACRLLLAATAQRLSRASASTSTAPRSRSSTAAAARSRISAGCADRPRPPARACSTATADFARLAEADAILICVPTPLDRHREPDLSYRRAHGREHRAPCLRPGQLVVLESTTYPGTTREVVLPDPRGRRPALRTRLLPRLLARARGPGQCRLRHRVDPQGGRRRRRRRAGGWPWRSTAAIVDRVGAGVLDRRSPRP